MDKNDFNIHILKEEKVYENNFGSLYDDIVEFRPQKVKGTYVRWKWKAPYSVAILPIILSNQIVLIENFRHSARKAIIEAPKGFGENNASPEKIAIKELYEETGLHAKTLDYKGIKITDAAFSYYPMHLFIAKGCYKSDTNHELSEVILGQHQYNINDIPKLLSNGSIEDAITYILLRIAYDEKQE